MDQSKAAYDARKKAIQAEKEARQKRLKDVPAELTISLEHLSDIHNFLSLLDLEKHHGKDKGSIELSNAISNLSQTITLIGKYARGYKNEEN